MGMKESIAPIRMSHKAAAVRGCDNGWSVPTAMSNAVFELIPGLYLMYSLGVNDYLNVLEATRYPGIRRGRETSLGGDGER